MKKLFGEFPPADYSTWINQITKDLKDKSIDVLEINPEKDISIRAYYHPQHDCFKGIQNSAATHFSKNSNNWSIRRIYSDDKNNTILKDLNEGVDAISLACISSEQFTKDSNGILFEHVMGDIRFNEKKSALDIEVPKETSLNFDIISLNLKKGEFAFELEDFVDFFERRKHNKSIWIDGFQYGNSGASTIQELAFTLAHLNEYLQTLTDKKIDLKSINEKINIEISVNENYFVNISKFRVIRELVALLFSAYDSKFNSITPSIYARTTSRFLAENDHNTNFIRQTTQAMSAIIGGCDALTISTLPSKTETDQILNDRMSKNIQLVLREESYFDKVVDPSSGSMFIESLTDQILEKSWNLFKEIETKGGLIECVKTNFIQNLIDENKKFLVEKIQSKNQTFLGINKFPNASERWIDVMPPINNIKGTFKTLTPFLLESNYQSKPVAS